MAITIASNIASLVGQRYLGRSTDALSSVFERLSSGQRINRASDDAAGLSVATSLSASVRQYSKAIGNINDGVSALSIADGALDSLTAITTRVQELAQQSANGSYSSTQRSALDTEAQALSTEFTRILATTKFNGQSLLDGTFTGIGLQIGIEGSNGNQIFIGADDVLGKVGNGTFGAQNTFSPLGITTLATRLVDVNGDGNLDMLSVSQSSGVDVFLGNGDGTFGTNSAYTAGAAPDDLNVGDVNGDGKVDIVVTNAGNSVTVLLGIGDGTFQSGTNFGLAAGSGPVAVAIGDLNGDGKADIVTANSGVSSSLGILYGNGDGSFQAQITLSAGVAATPSSIQIVDINGDGKLDLVSAESAAGAVGVFLNRGDGTFNAQVTFSTGGGSAPQTAYTADVNGDGKLDLVTANSATNSVGVLIGNGDGTFNVQKTLSTGAGSSPRMVLIADINGDGKLDLISANRNTGTFGIFLGNGDGSFNSQTAKSTGGSSTPVALAIGDVNKDGGLDIVSANSTQSELGLYLANLRNQNYFLINLSTQSSSRATLDYAGKILSQISQVRGSIGAQQGRLQSALNNTQTIRENYSAASSRITDSDVASETSELTKNNILQQSGVAVLAQANNQPALVLQLLR